MSVSVRTQAPRPEASSRREALLREAEAQRALAELFPHMQREAMRAIQDLFPLVRQAEAAQGGQRH
jgi:hypothetical protein